MKTRTLAITLLFLAAAFAGCSGSDPDESTDLDLEDVDTLIQNHLSIPDEIFVFESVSELGGECQVGVEQEDITPFEQEITTNGTSWVLVGGQELHCEDSSPRWYNEVKIAVSVICENYSINGGELRSAINYAGSSIIPVDDGPCSVTLSTRNPTVAYFQPYEVVPFTGE